MTPISCWNNYPISQAFLKRPEATNELIADALAKSKSTLARGLGRSYGDAAINTGNNIILMERMNRFQAFDEKRGILRAESGISLEEIIDVFVPRGWFLPVTPGTKYATLGGCFAADVHGKNHHCDGSFSQYVTEIELLLADGSLCRCSKDAHSDLFWATAGGMGLTGIITEVSLQLVPIETPLISTTYRAAQNIEQLLSYMDNQSLEDKYSVAWIDCLSGGEALGRGIFMTGHHASKREADPFKCKKKRTISVPCRFPSWTLNSWTIKVFNDIYYKKQKEKGRFFSNMEDFFYPLDMILNWNRIYGRKGFLQYQFVVPKEMAYKALPEVLKKISASQQASFLAVLKRFGKETPGPLSFPFEGITLALDIPIRNGAVFALLDEIDKMLLNYGGRVYSAKDASLKPETFRKMYPRYGEWLKVKSSCDPLNHFDSDLARRLQLEVQR